MRDLKKWLVLAAVCILSAVVCGCTDSKETSGNEAGDMISQTSVRDAITLDRAWKNVYAGVISGTLTKESKCADGSYCDWAADKTASAAERKEAAQSVTIAQVQAYDGTHILLEDMYYVTEEDTEKHFAMGTILYWDGNPDNKPTENLSDEPITEDTTIGELHSE